MLGTLLILSAIIGLCLRLSRWLDCLTHEAAGHDASTTPMRRRLRLRLAGTFWPVL